MKKNQIHFTIFSLILVLIISLVFPFGGPTKTQVDASTKKNVKPAIENTITEVTDPKLLDRFNHLQFGKGYWQPVTSDNQRAPRTVFEQTEVDEKGYFSYYTGTKYGRVTQNQTSSRKTIEFLVDGMMGSPNGTSDVGAIQTIRTIKGHRYQLSYQGLSSEINKEAANKRLVNPQIPFENSPIGSISRGGRTLVDLYLSKTIDNKPDFREADAESNLLKTMSFTGTGEEVTILVGAMPDIQGISSVSYSHLAVLDLDQGIEEVRTGVDGLFTDDTHSKLHLPIVQEDLDAVQDQIDLDLILDPLVKDFYQKELDKAQALLDAVDPTIQIEALVDNPKDEHSYTLIGKSYPDALIRFEGVATIPNPTMPSDNPRAQASYHVRTDAQGNFRMALPKGKFFHAGEVVTGTSMIHGKTATTHVTVQDVVAPKAPTLSPIRDQDEAFTGQAEVGTTVSILDAKQKEVAKAKTGTNGQFSVAIPADKQPLTPYVDYVAVATDDAGNKSPISNRQTVQDTTPPEAKAVKHTFRQGEAPPKDPSHLLQDIYDNAGVEPDNLTVTYETKPDFTQSGSQVVTVKLEDKAGNRTLIRVPVEIIARENGAGSNTGSGNPTAGAGNSQHIGGFSLPSTGDRGVPWTVALGAFLLLATSTVFIFRRKKQS